MYRVFVLVAISLAMTLSLSNSASAQPSPVSPAECTVEPLDVDELVDAATGPVPRRAELMPTDDPVSDRELRQITRVVEMMTACANANQPLRSLALVTETYMAEYFAGPDGQDQLGHLIAASTRSPDPAEPDDRLVMIAIDEPVRYEDGRIGVTVVTANAEAQFTDQLIFTETDDGWRLDQVVLGASQNLTATPTA